MRDIRVVTPDGYVWYIRRRWTRRRTPWRPLVDAVAARRRRARGWTWGPRERLGPDPEPFPPSYAGGPGELGEIVVLLGALGVVLLVLAVGGVVWLVVTVAVPWLLLHLKTVLSVLAGGFGVVALVLIRRPWLVEAERQGLDPPRRAWRVIGWRRSGQCAREVAGAIAQGRLDVEPANARPTD
jgi:hypothetical protein